MYGCLNAWSSNGWHIGMPLDENSNIYFKGVTMTFASIVVAQVGNVLACRTSKASLFKTNLKSNRWIWLGIIAQFSILSAIVYTPPLQKIFGTTALGLNEWVYLLFLVIIVILAEETRKFLTRKLAK
jgi:magnesium-transporting ATPase (P-type)